MSFVAVGFLAGLAALVVPWWLHRREARRTLAQPVSSLYLMRPGDVPERRQRTLRYRVLLSLRMGLLAALALAFAQPVFEQAIEPGDDAAALLPRLIVLDTSLSMASGFADARRQARQLIDELPAGTAAAVVSAAAELSVLSALSVDRARLYAAVDGAAPGATRLSFDGLLGRVATLAGTLSESPVETHVISDFQGSSLPPQFNSLIGGVESAVVLHAVDGPGDNWSVERISAGADVEVSVRSFAGRDRELTVALERGGGDAQQQQRVTVPAGGSAVVRFAASEGARGDVWVRAAIDADDALAADDVAYHVVRRTRLQPLPLYASAAGVAQSDYLSAAVAAAAPQFHPADPSASGPVAALLDPGTLAPDRVRLLERHLRNGGAVFLTLGPVTERAGVLPLTGTPLRTRRADADGPARTVVDVDRSHPAVAGTASWRDVAVFRHLVPQTLAGADVLVELDDGSPLVVEYRLAAGRLLVLTTALDPQWSTLVTQPAWVTLAGDSLAYLAEDFLPSAARAGEAVAVPAASMQIFDRAGRRLLSLSDTVRQPPVRLVTPGVYTLRTPGRERLLAVNPDPRESDPQPADPELLARWRAALAAATPVANDVPETALAATVPLAPWLLVALLLLALVEPLVANAGRREVAA